MLQIVICEDNEHSLQSIASAIEKILEHNYISGKVVCRAKNPKEVEEFIKHNPANVFFLDIDLKSEENGYTLAQKIRRQNISAYIIFVTCHFEFVLQAFKVHSFDFLMKPVSKDILEQCIISIYENYVVTNHVKDSFDDYIQIKSGATLYRIKIKDIIYIEKLRYKTVICTVKSKIYCYETLDSLEKMLSGPDLVRCHKSYIANKKYICEINFKQKVIFFETGHECLLGGKYRKELVTSASV